MHLSVSDLERSQRFYESLGMELMLELGGMMRFMSWDGYHHHLGINLLQGRGAAPVETDVSGLAGFEVTRGASTTADPDGIEVRVPTPAV